jgi:hypothetical protein
MDEVSNRWMWVAAVGLLALAGLAISASAWLGGTPQGAIDPLVFVASIAIALVFFLPAASALRFDEA